MAYSVSDFSASYFFKSTEQKKTFVNVYIFNFSLFSTGFHYSSCNLTTKLFILGIIIL